MPGAEKLHWRAEQFARLRDFLTQRGALEVAVPLVFPEPATDPDIDVPRVVDTQGRLLGYLQSSPEFALKRLVAESRLDLFSLGSVFRLNESGPKHALEFTLLEWYRVGWNHDALMAEVGLLTQALLGTRPVRKVRYKDAFADVFQVCPLQASDADIQALLGQVDYVGPPLSRDAALQLLNALKVEPGLGKGSIAFLYDYPPGQAALARRIEDDDGLPVAARFEVFVDGVELANGYWELTDAAEQRRRMQQDLRERAERGLPEVPLDEAFLSALVHLPDCAGVALGVDRLLMLAAGERSIQPVRLF